MFVFDAFRAFNSSHSGLLSCSEFYGGLEWLNIRLTPDQIYDLVRKIAVDNEGLISYLDFKRVFQGADDEFESRGEDADSFGVVQPKKIPELVDLGKVTDNNDPRITLNYNRLLLRRKWSCQRRFCITSR